MPAAASNDKRGRDEHLGLKFWIQIDGVEVAGFSECTPITVETETYEYPEGGLNTHTHKVPVRTKYSNITLKRGIDPGRDMYSWYMASIDAQLSRKNITINIYGQQGPDPVKQWHLQDAFPVKWTGPDLKTEAGAVAVESLEFAYAHIVDSNAGKPGSPGRAPTPQG